MSRIELSHVTKLWGKFYAVDDLSMVIEDNAFVTLLGPSGCGKTTTLRMIAGLETPTSGRITIDGVPVFDSELGINVPPNKRHVGFLFQNYALWPNMTVYQNIAFGLTNMKMPKKEIDETVERVSKIVKIGPFMNRYPSELSGGQQQRVAIARTLAPNPKVLFMDEPLSNLDAKLRLEMRSELQRLHLSTGATFVYVTHDQMEAMTLATKICLINNGVLQQYDEPLTVYGRPNNTFVADFVGSPSINFVNAKGAQNADGTIGLEILNGQKAFYTPAESVKMEDWFAEAKRKAEENPETAGKENQDTLFKPHIAMVEETENEETPALTHEDFVLGIRPEMISIAETGEIEGEVFSAMPTGMETTVKVRVGNYLLTAVVFGGITYKIGQKVHLSFKGSGLLLFSRENGRLVCEGSLKIG